MRQSALLYVTRTVRARLCLVLIPLLALSVVWSLLFLGGISTEHNSVDFFLNEIVWSHRHDYTVQYSPGRTSPPPRVRFSFAGLSVIQVFTTMGDENVPDSYQMVGVFHCGRFGWRSWRFLC